MLMVNILRLLCIYFYIVFFKLYLKVKCNKLAFNQIINILNNSLTNKLTTVNDNLRVNFLCKLYIVLMFDG